MSIHNSVTLLKLKAFKSMTKIRLPAIEGYQPSIRPDNIQTRGYQPQQVTTTTASANKAPPKKP